MTRLLVVCLLVAACAPIETRQPPEVRTQVVEVKVNVPVPCFTEEQRPRLAPPTVVDLSTATVDQLAAAMAADDLAETLYARAVDALFLQCMNGGKK